MVNKEIFGGIKSAVSKGYSLKSAMQSFYNAGYKKEEIYGAAKEFQKAMYLQEQQKRQELLEKKSVSFLEKIRPFKKSVPVKEPSISAKAQSVAPVKRKPATVQRVSKYGEESPKANLSGTQIIKRPIKPLPSQKMPSQKIVSEYNSKDVRPKKDILAIILVVVLLTLIGILAAVFFFKKEILIFFESFLE